MLKYIFLLLFIVLGLAFKGHVPFDSNVIQGLTPQSSTASGSDQRLAEAWERQQSGVLVEGRGTVEKLLSDDLEGHRHQRFILRLASGQILLVAHNIDFAPRIHGLAVGDEVAFFGQYEWNPKGGVIHWTHHDPAGRHPAGWLRHQGQLYQ
ncbi:MAG: DUF3465 domain-containing protein [Halothiobacillaceae bacterium]